MRVVKYLIYYLVGDAPNPIYKQQFFLGLIEAETKKQALQLAKEKWVGVEGKLHALASGGKYAPKPYKKRVEWLANGNSGIYKG